MAINTYIANPVSQTITDGVTNKAPSENVVFDALAGKQPALGFTPENLANKQTDLTASATKYPTVDAVNIGLSGKQATLISGTNIKTISGLSILGSGNLDYYLSNPSLNSIATVDSDLIIANNQTQANTITGASSLRSIFGGYDNTIGANLASGIVCSHHSIIKDTANHATIIGGSTNVISGASSYSTVLAGLNCEINAVRSSMISCELSTVLNGTNGFVGAISCNALTIGAGVGSYIFAGSSNGSIFLSADSHKSIVGGSGNSVSGGYVFIGQGQSCTVSGNRATVLNGSSNQATRNEATILGGQSNVAQGVKSTVINGQNCTAFSYNEVVFGNYPTTYTPGSTSTQVLTDRALTIGNGTGTGARSDAFIVLKSGEIRPSGTVKCATGTATFAPLKLTAGTNLTSPESGAFEFDGANLYFTIGGVRKTVTLV